MTETDNYHGGTFTRWIAALSAATCNVRVNIGAFAVIEVKLHFSSLSALTSSS
jgi:hypothetical protein